MIQNRHTVAAIMFAAAFGTLTHAAATAEVAIGSKIGDVASARDMQGNVRHLHDFEGQAFVLLFVGIDCPIANLYMPRLIELEAEYRARDVQFLAVYPNEPEAVDRVAAHAYERGVPFPVLKDFGQELAGAVGATRTPEVCVLDERFVLKYRGRIDDQYAVATRRPQPRHHDLTAALDAVLAGEQVARADVKADGCLINRTQPNLTTEPLTFHRDIEPIMQQRCQECHRKGQIGPFTLTSYQDLLDNVEPVAEVVRQRRMPPWHADERYGSFHNARRLSDGEITTLLSWIEQGMPQGDPADAPPPRNWLEGWQIEQPDVVIEMPIEAEIPAEGVLPYRYYFVPTNFKEDRWARMAEAKPGNPSVVHHIIVYMISPGRASLGGDNESGFLVGFAPGSDAVKLPPGAALRIPKGAEFVFELHYTPTGVPQTDRSSVGIVFADGPPKREVFVNFFEHDDDLFIPANDPHHSQRATFRFPSDSTLISVLPHMHWRGKAYHYDIEYPDGTKDVLASIPRYDFNWQTTYQFAEPLEIPKGTVVRSVAHWDNSHNNLANPDPSRNVEEGLQTTEEMMLGFLTYTTDEPVVGQLPVLKPNPFIGAMFKRLDKDKSGYIELEEIPKPMRAALAQEGIEFGTGLSRLGVEALMSSQ